VYDVARETPLEPASSLSSRLGSTVLLKREDLQPTFSFKVRGAYNRIAHLTPDQRRAGVITASAGNHAQGVALSAQRLSVPALIVMPETTPRIKVDAVRALGADVVLRGDTYADAAAHCGDLLNRTGMILVHPFDDLMVIAGQGTIGMELARQAGVSLDAVFVPVGGGGLIAGIGTYLKVCRPSVRVIGVEPIDADAMYRSLQAGRRVQLDHVGLFADGVAVNQVGQLPFTLCRDAVDEVVRVTDDQICAAIRDVFEETRTVVEPAGALGVAGAHAWLARNPSLARCAVAIVSGANMNFDRLPFVVERASRNAAQ
jgi:threonine dehydratase